MCVFVRVCVFVCVCVRVRVCVCVYYKGEGLFFGRLLHVIEHPDSAVSQARVADTLLEVRLTRDP